MSRSRPFVMRASWPARPATAKFPFHSDAGTVAKALRFLSVSAVERNPHPSDDSARIVRTSRSGKRRAQVRIDAFGNLASPVQELFGARCLRGHAPQEVGDTAAFPP